MTFFDFADKLRRCNPHLRVVLNGDATKWAGIAHSRAPEYNISAVSKQGLTDNQSLKAHNGTVLIKSVRDVLFELVGRGALGKEKAERVFNVRLDKRWPPVTLENTASAMAVVQRGRSLSDDFEEDS